MLTQQNCDRSKETAGLAQQIALLMYPGEEWQPLEHGIFIAKSRLPKSANQFSILEKEVIQARYLVGLGKTIYLIPESGKKQKHPDAIVDGIITEMKTVSGSLEQTWKNFSKARKKSEKPIDVFLYIHSNDSNNTIKNIKPLFKRKITMGDYHDGLIYILLHGEDRFHIWSVNDLIKNPAEKPGAVGRGEENLSSPCTI
jgi:hypothetical protein